MRCGFAHASFAWPLICWRANLTWRISWRIRMFSRRICKKSRKPDQGRKRRGDHKIRFQYWNVSIPVISLFLSKISNQVLLPSPLSSLCVLNSDCHQYLTRQKDNYNLLFLFGYRVLKFGMTFLSHFVIHLLLLVININWEIIFNHDLWLWKGNFHIWSVLSNTRNAPNNLYPLANWLFIDHLLGLYMDNIICK